MCRSRLNGLLLDAIVAKQFKYHTFGLVSLSFK